MLHYILLYIAQCILIKLHYKYVKNVRNEILLQSLTTLHFKVSLKHVSKFILSSVKKTHLNGWEKLYELF